PRTFKRKRSAIRKMSDDEFRKFRNTLLTDPQSTLSRGKKGRAHRVQRKRNLHRRVRAALAVRRLPLPRNLSKKLLTYELEESAILKALVPNRDQIWTKMAKRRPRQSPMYIDLIRFTFADAPQETMHLLQKVAHA